MARVIRWIQVISLQIWLDKYHMERDDEVSVLLGIHFIIVCHVSALFQI